MVWEHFMKFSISLCGKITYTGKLCIGLIFTYLFLYPPSNAIIANVPKYLLTFIPSPPNAMSPTASFQHKKLHMTVQPQKKVTSQLASVTGSKNKVIGICQAFTLRIVPLTEN